MDDRPLVKVILSSRIQEFDTVAISGKSLLGLLIQDDDGVLRPQLLTGSSLSHVAIAIRVGSTLKWFEFAEKGGQFASLSKYTHIDKGGLALLRPTETFIQPAIDSMRLKVSQLEGLPYDALGLVGKLLHLIARRKRYKKNPLSGSGYFCSAGVELIYRAGGLFLTEYDDVRLNEPKDFFLTDKLRRIL